MFALIAETLNDMAKRLGCSQNWDDDHLQLIMAEAGRSPIDIVPIKSSVDAAFPRGLRTRVQFSSVFVSHLALKSLGECAPKF